MIINFKNIACGGGGKAPVVEALSVTENGTYTVPEGVDGYSPVDVNVPAPTPKVEEKTVSIISNGQTIVEKSADVDGMTKVTVDVNVPTDTGKFKIPNGTRFKTVPSTFKIQDYDWSIFDNFISPFSDHVLLKNQDIIEEYKKLHTKVRFVNLYNDNGDAGLDFRGVDMSECYFIRIMGSVAKGDINFTGCDLRKVQYLEIFNSKFNVYLDSCELSSVCDISLNALNAAEQFNKNIRNCPSLLKYPYINGSEPMAIDLSNMNLESMKYAYDNNWTKVNSFKADNTIIKPVYIGNWFRNNYEIESLDLSFLDLSICGNLQGFVSGLPNLKTVTGVGSLRSPYSVSAFQDSPVLETVDLSKWNLLGTTIYGLLSGCPNLTEVKFPYNIESNIDLSVSVNLSKESLLSLLNGLYDFKGVTGHTCTIGPENMAKLTAEELKVAADKGWEIK